MLSPSEKEHVNKYFLTPLEQRVFLISLARLLNLDITHVSNKFQEVRREAQHYLQETGGA